MGIKQNIQWFPGHMAKTRRKLKEDIKLVDMVVEILDARIPISSRNPEIMSIINNKPHIILLNKSDMADKNETLKWINYYKEKYGVNCIAVDCQSGKGLSEFLKCSENTLKEKMEVWKSKGMIGRKIRAMIVGVPNVGKSSFINRMSKNSKAKAEDRPGVTRGNQWFTVGNKMEMLDTPGILWPKFDDEIVGRNLAFTGAIKDDILDVEDLAFKLIDLLRDRYITSIAQRYKLNESEIKECETLDLMNMIGKKRGMIISGGEVDIQRVSNMILDEFRAAKIGKITLERVDEIEKH